MPPFVVNLRREQAPGLRFDVQIFFKNLAIFAFSIILRYNLFRSFFCKVTFMMENDLLITFKKVDKGTKLAAALLDFVKGFSWEEVKAHTVRVIENWEFEEWETPFVAMAGNCIVGMVTVMKTDYYPLPEIYPWVSTLFVTEEYRGRRISERLIAFANSYAKDLGFEKTYIPSEHIGLYEKYGYRYIKDIVNYGGGTDRLYAKDLI